MAHGYEHPHQPQTRRNLEGSEAKGAEGPPEKKSQAHHHLLRAQFRKGHRKWQRRRCLPGPLQERKGGHKESKVQGEPERPQIV